jgi:hypothetical protein
VIRLLVEYGSDPIEGSLTADERPAIAFRGWLELASAIERSHERPPVAHPSPTPKEQP